MFRTVAEYILTFGWVPRQPRIISRSGAELGNIITHSCYTETSGASGPSIPGGLRLFFTLSIFVDINTHPSVNSASQLPRGRICVCTQAF